MNPHQTFRTNDGARCFTDCSACRDERDGVTDSTPATAAKPVNEWPVRIGGLIRCCTETLRVDAGWAKEGQVIDCLYCSSSMRLRDGAWEWNRD